MRDKVIKVIKRKCGKMTMLKSGWYHFTYKHLHFVYIPEAEDEMVRISIPHVANCNEHNKEILNAAINETNRKVKYIKVVILNNGSVSLNYDHMASDGENIDMVVSHMIDTLFIACLHLIKNYKKLGANLINNTQLY